MKDWREGYVICEHVAENSEKGTYHSNFRVCCEECYNKGFLSANLSKEKRGKLSIGKLNDD